MIRTYSFLGCAVVFLLLLPVPGEASFSLGGGYSGKTGKSMDSAGVEYDHSAYADANHYFYASIFDRSPISVSALQINSTNETTRITARYTSRSGAFLIYGQSRMRDHANGNSQTSTGELYGYGYRLDTRLGTTEIYTVRDKLMGGIDVLSGRQTIRLGNRLLLDFAYRHQDEFEDEFRAGVVLQF